MNFCLVSVPAEDYVIAFVGFSIVFATLIVLYFVFRYASRVIHYVEVKLTSKKNKKEGRPAVSPAQSSKIPGGDNAAIAMALYMYFNELHDEEDPVITIERVSKTYSPWSSKIYGVRNFMNLNKR